MVLGMPGVKRDAEDDSSDDSDDDKDDDDGFETPLVDIEAIASAKSLGAPPKRADRSGIGCRAPWDYASDVPRVGCGRGVG